MVGSARLQDAGYSVTMFRSTHGIRPVQRTAFPGSVVSVLGQRIAPCQNPREAHPVSIADVILATFGATSDVWAGDIPRKGDDSPTQTVG